MLRLISSQHGSAALPMLTLAMGFLEVSGLIWLEWLSRWPYRVVYWSSQVSGRLCAGVALILNHRDRPPGNVEKFPPQPKQPTPLSC
jgi:hypothetical protein